MSSKIVDGIRRTAAWRVSVLTTVAFALGTGAAFGVAYVIVSRGIRDRSDAWLRGETELLAEVAATTAPGDVSGRMIEEVAELATHEVLPTIREDGLKEQPVFFYVPPSEGRPELWVGPSDRKAFIAPIGKKKFQPGSPRSIVVAGWPHPFRVNLHQGEGGSRVYLGLLDHSALELLGKIRRTFIELWLGMLVFGFLVSCLSARRILGRVERITETAAQIGTGDLHRRVPEGGGRDEISRLANTFNGMLARLETSVDHLRSFGDTVAHDLRSPVTSIRGNLEMALTSSDPEELREVVASALERIDRLLSILNTTLDVAEAEAGVLRLHRREIDARDLVSEMVELYRPAIEESGLTIEMQGDRGVVARLDADLVRRALANLLDNAIQHLPSGKHVTVTVESADGLLTLRVADDGPGLPADLRGRAFERFARGPESLGSGIGLSMVRAAAIAHGGEARIVESPRGGACVTLTFPLEPTAAGPAAALTGTARG